MLDRPARDQDAISDRTDRALLERALRALAEQRYEEVECCRAGLDRESAWHAALGAALAQARGRLDEALAAWNAAVARDPSLLFARYNRALLLEHRGALEAAVVDLEAAADLAPDDAEVRADLGRVLWRLGRLEEALAALDRALALDPALVGAHNDRGLVLRALGRQDEALAAFSAAAAKNPGYLPARLNQVELHCRANRFEEAVTASAEALAAGARSAELLYWRGCALRGTGRGEEALAALDEAVALDPDHARAHCERGLVLLELDREQEALAAFDRSARCTTGLAPTELGVGMALARLGRHQQALAAIDRALALDPRYVEALVERGNVLRVLGRTSEALAAYEAALALQPGNAAIHSNRGNILMDTGHLAEARAALERAIELDPTFTAAFDNLLWCACYDPSVDRRTAIDLHRRFGARFGDRPERFRDWPNEPTADRPLRIGFVSADLNRHPVGFMLLAVAEALDRARFPLFFYATGSNEDWVSERLRGLASAWHRVAALGDRALAELVRQERIDILVDLAGHTAGNRLGCFALQPAPVQASWLGYPFTTGLREIGWIVMDPISVRPGEEDLFVERVIHLPGGRFVLQPPAGAPPVVLPPALTSGRVTFGSFNNLSKMTPEVVATWAAILHRVPGSRLLLKWRTLADPAVVAEVREAYAGQGIDPGRLILRPASGYVQMLAEYGEVDIALDPFPFGGGQTSLDALWMGTPLVTLPSWQPASRQGAMLLEAARRPEWIADDPEDYVEVVVELAQDPGRLAGLRLGQREQIRRSPLCDPRRAARELEAALRTMWEDWLARRAAR
ncbi:MAG: tetratricopeptide repeat protein [Geminicoccaceae bacterium]|nr:tetratricopeptide repeat protein [Geminicoccaceae bacterium]